MGASYFLKIDGRTVTKNFDPVLVSLTINLQDGGKSDTLDIVLDDSNGQIALPRAGADIEAAIWWDVPPPGATRGAVTFRGKTDEPESEGSRGGGMLLSISAKSADLAGKGKEKVQKHKDKATFGDAAKEFGQTAGYTVKVHSDLAGVFRDYWHIGESFYAWGRRIAEDIGATFKVSDKTAVFVPRNGDQSASGKPLASVDMVRPGNVISWTLSPVFGRGQYERVKVRYYDTKEAKLKTEEVEIGGKDAKSALIDTYRAGTKDQAKTRAKALAEDAKRAKGGGSVTIIGTPAAVPQAKANVRIRDGIDGGYVIKSASHVLKRGGGWTVRVDLEKPDDKTGKDGRKKSATPTENRAGFASPSQRA